MKYDPSIHHRQSIRLRGYNYSASGAYFVTVCTLGKERLFGGIHDDDMNLNDTGRIVEAVWKGLPERFPDVVMDEYVVMPNHVHGIISICLESGTTNGGVRDGMVAGLMGRRGKGAIGTRDTGAMDKGAMDKGAMNRAPTALHTPPVGAQFIAPASNTPPEHIPPGLGEIIRTFKALSTRLIRKEHMTEFAWQRNYYERIIHTEKELTNIREYIIRNPARWAEDPENQEANP